MTTQSTRRFPGAHLTCLTLLTLIACDGGAALLTMAPAEPLHSHGAAHHALPLRGQLAGNATLTSPEAACAEMADYLATATLELTGTMSHLGRVTWTSTDCTSLAGFPDEIRFTGGTGVITAADGDELRFTFTGSGSVVDFVPDGFISQFEGDATITGGTGRFRGATGGFFFTGLLQAPASTVELQVDGWISYDAGDRTGG